MPEDDVVIRSARNAFMLMLLLLLAVSTYQFYTIGGVTTPVAAMWVTGAGVFYASKYYYGRQDEGTAEDGDVAGETEKD